jgi:hypothetical protein
VCGETCMLFTSCVQMRLNDAIAQTCTSIRDYSFDSLLFLLTAASSKACLALSSNTVLQCNPVADARIKHHGHDLHCCEFVNPAMTLFGLQAKFASTARVSCRVDWSNTHVRSHGIPGCWRLILLPASAPVAILLLWNRSVRPRSCACCFMGTLRLAA